MIASLTCEPGYHFSDDREILTLDMQRAARLHKVGIQLGIPLLFLALKAVRMMHFVTRSYDQIMTTL